MGQHVTKPFEGMNIRTYPEEVNFFQSKIFFGVKVLVPERTFS